MLPRAWEAWPLLTWLALKTKVHEMTLRTSSIAIALVATFAVACAFAADNDPQKTFDDAKALGQNLNSKAVSGIKSGTSTTSVPNYQPGASLPEAAAYAKEGDSAAAAKQLACKNNPNDASCSGLNSGLQSRPRQYIKLTDPAVSGLSVARDPSKIIGDFAKTYSACTVTSPALVTGSVFEDRNCKIDITQNTCDAVLTVVPNDKYNCTPGTWFYQETIPRVVHGGSDQMHIGVYCRPMDGGGQLQFEVYAHGSDGACAGWQVFNHQMNAPTGRAYVAYLAPDWDDGCHSMYVYQEGPGCVNGTCSTTFYFDWPGREGYTKTITFAEPKIIQLHGESWSNTCGPYENQVQDPKSAATTTNADFGKPSCTLTSKVCVDGPSTKIIDGVSVKRDCWDWQSLYSCSAASSANSATCAGTALDNCKQVGQPTCTSFGTKGVCLQQNIPFQCPVSDATYTPAVNCGPSTYCANGECYTQTNRTDGDFSKSVSYLSAAAEAAKDLDVATLKIFTGAANECVHKVFGLLDCCDTSDDPAVLGQISDTAHNTFCSNDEANLATLRSKGVCYHVGHYCSQHFLGACVKDHESYCCFHSKLARIVNVGGKAQLGISFGDPKSPNCDGFTIDQIQKIDFSQIDFSEFYADIKPIIPDSLNQSTNAGKNVSNCYYGAGKC